MARPKAAEFPARKISETLLDFAGPILPYSDAEAYENRLREALQLSSTAWNAVVFADVLNDQHYLELMRRLTSGQREAVLLIDQLIIRKRTHFANDSRLIGDWELKHTETGLTLHANAHDPHTLPPRSKDES